MNLVGTIDALRRQGWNGDTQLGVITGFVSRYTHQHGGHHSVSVLLSLLLEDFIVDR